MNKRRLENSVKDEISDYLTSLGIYHEKTHGNSFEPRGRPDIIACINGRYTAFELKRDEQEEPTGIQKKRLRQIRESGGIAEVVWSLDQVKSIIERMM